MIFILIGILLLILKLIGHHPVSDWDWFVFSVPFCLALIWFEIIEPMLGLDIKNEHLKNRQFEERKKYFEKKTPLRKNKGFFFKR
jgi:small Trp-rich protein